MSTTGTRNFFLSLVLCTLYTYEWVKLKYLCVFITIVLFLLLYKCNCRLFSVKLEHKREFTHITLFCTNFLCVNKVKTTMYHKRKVLNFPQELALHAYINLQQEIFAKLTLPLPYGRTHRLAQTSFSSVIITKNFSLATNP